MYHYTYVLLSDKDGRFYSGGTGNLKVRFEEHCRGRVASIKDRRPLNLVYYEACRDKKDASHREQYFKTYHGKMFLRNRLKSYLTGCKSF
jgi:putative endonuclease